MAPNARDEDTKVEKKIAAPQKSPEQRRCYRLASPSGPITPGPTAPVAPVSAPSGRCDRPSRAPRGENRAVAPPHRASRGGVVPGGPPSCHRIRRHRGGATASLTPSAAHPERCHRPDASGAGDAGAVAPPRIAWRSGEGAVEGSGASLIGRAGAAAPPRIAWRSDEGRSRGRGEACLDARGRSGGQRGAARGKPCIGESGSTTEHGVGDAFCGRTGEGDKGCRGEGRTDRSVCVNRTIVTLTPAPLPEGEGLVTHLRCAV